MCQKIMRSPFARGGIAKYWAPFVADATDRGFTRDTQWLIWKYESDTTLAEASQACSPALLAAALLVTVFGGRQACRRAGWQLRNTFKRI